MNTSKRLLHIDLIESIAIFFVLIYHCTIYSFDFLSDSSALNYLSYFLTTILSTCVPLFFFANGYLLFNRPFDLKKHLYRTLRLVILVFLWAFILMPLYMLILNKNLSIKEALLQILNMSTAWGMNLFWFLGALVCMYILFPALKALFDSNKKAFIWFTIICAFLTFGFDHLNDVLNFISVASGQWIGTLNFTIFKIFNPFRGTYGYSFVYFCVGGLAHIYLDKILSISRFKRNLFSAIGILISCGFLFLLGVFYSRYVNASIWDVVWEGYDTVFTFCNVICIFILSLNYTKEVGIITSISKSTLGIYFIHGIFINLTKQHLRSIPILCNIPVNIIYAFLILIICLAITVVIKKIPLLRKLV